MACPLPGEPLALGPGEDHPDSASETRAPVRPQPPQQHLQPACGSAAAAVMVEALDDAEGLYVAVERCPLCNTARRRLTCARCIQNGDFVYVDGRNPERCVFISFLSFFLFTLCANTAHASILTVFRFIKLFHIYLFYLSKSSLLIWSVFSVYMRFVNTLDIILLIHGSRMLRC